VKTKYFYQKGVLYVKGEKSDAYMWNWVYHFWIWNSNYYMKIKLLTGN